MHRPGTHRLQALVLALTLVFGGFGLPLLDAIYFHSAAAATPVQRSDSQVGESDGGVAHLFGCAALTSAVSGSGLPALGTAPVGSAPRLQKPHLPLSQICVTHTDLTVSQPRAPPIA